MVTPTESNGEYWTTLFVGPQGHTVPLEFVQGSATGKVKSALPGTNQ